jgi:hypothetical protein
MHLLLRWQWRQRRAVNRRVCARMQPESAVASPLLFSSHREALCHAPSRLGFGCSAPSEVKGCTSHVLSQWWHVLVDMLETAMRRAPCIPVCAMYPALVRQGCVEYPACTAVQWKRKCNSQLQPTQSNSGPVSGRLEHLVPLHLYTCNCAS